MKKKNRILKNLDFKTILKKGKKLNSYNLSLFYLLNNNTHRIGITVSKNVSKHAVVRNLVKRRVVAAINELKIEDSLMYDVVIIAKPNSALINYKNIREEILFLFSKII